MNEEPVSPISPLGEVEQKTLGTVKRFKNWFLSRAHSPHAQVWLGVLSFTESSFFPIAPDLLLIAMLLAGGERWFRYATITTVTSVMGALFGYFIGAVLYETLGRHFITFYGFEQEFLSLGDAFADNVFWTIFTAAFTPIPYKVFTIAGGFFNVNIFMFVLASITGRALRFYVIAYLCKRYGKKLGFLIEKYFNTFSLIFVLLIFIGYLLLAFNLSF